MPDSFIDPWEHFQIPVKRTFSKLSSGHKVVLLIITCCVNKIEEKSIVFLDEPENHLHPPLLSALIRALSELPIDRNGVAVVSTHSPVVLQEVPSSCVWTLRRCGDQMIPERLAVETFGSSISQLTNEVFGLEVTDSGFHKMLSEAVRQKSGSVFPVNDYDRIVREFDGQFTDICEMRSSAEANDLNSWKSALYRGLEKEFTKVRAWLLDKCLESV